MVVRSRNHFVTGYRIDNQGNMQFQIEIPWDSHFLSNGKVHRKESTAVTIFLPCCSDILLKVNGLKAIVLSC